MPAIHPVATYCLEYKYNSQTNTKKMNNPIEKWAVDLNREFSEDDTHVSVIFKRCSPFLSIKEMEIKNHFEILSLPSQNGLLFEVLAEHRFCMGCSPSELVTS